jgi:hypothetical protein
MEGEEELLIQDIDADCQKWAQLGQEHKRQIISTVRKEYGRYVKKYGNCPNAAGKGAIADEVYKIAVVEGRVPITKPVLRKYVLIELNKLDRCGRKHESHGNTRGKSQGGMELYYTPKLDSKILEILTK